MAIRACSYIDEVVVDTPKPLFSRFQRLGVFQWKDVYTVAKNNIHQEIMAFRFSRTETFDHYVDRDTLNALWLEVTGEGFHPPQSPRSIPKELFFEIYKAGFGNRRREHAC
jgi:hypothetical protein